MKNSFKSLKIPSESLVKEKGSKFIGLASPCFSEAEAKELLNQWKSKHQQATHLCYAFRVGVNHPVFRSSDDGEPSNSAGAPILGQIQSFELTNILLGVVRYYGGTKLGVGGLIGAYRQAAKEAIENGEIIERELLCDLEIRVDFSNFPGVMNLIKQTKANIKKQVQGESCLLDLEIENSKFDRFKSQLESNAGIQIITETRRT